VFLGAEITYIADLDEFGHIGPYVSRTDPRYNSSPVFGLAGIVLPVEEVRSFGTWFFQLKCNLLAWEIAQAGVHPATWEKKGSALYTEANVRKYQQLRHATNRLFNRIEKAEGFVFYVGIKKLALPAKHNPNYLYIRMLLEAMKRLNHFCELDCGPAEGLFLALDEHDQRDI
jgi:hypothetical protein